MRLERPIGAVVVQAAGRGSGTLIGLACHRHGHGNVGGHDRGRGVILTGRSGIVLLATCEVVLTAHIVVQVADAHDIQRACWMG